MPNQAQSLFLLATALYTSQRAKNQFVKIANITNLFNFMPSNTLLMQLDVDPASVLTGRTMVGISGYTGDSSVLNGIYIITSISSAVTIQTLDGSPAYSGPREGQGFIYYVN